MACDKLLDVVGGLVPPNQTPTKAPEDQGRNKTKAKKGEITVWWTVFVEWFLALVAFKRF